jgi:hypothetical protein
MIKGQIEKADYMEAFEVASQSQFRRFTGSYEQFLAANNLSGIRVAFETPADFGDLSRVTGAIITASSPYAKKVKPGDEVLVEPTLIGTRCYVQSLYVLDRA